MSQLVELRGISWNHSRAFPPLVATAQRFEELNPAIRISWEKRTLDEFGHASLGPLAERFDLLVIDHPMLGTASRDSLLIPLDEHLDSRVVDSMKQEFIGPSFESYVFEGHLWALPIDAAAPAASYRPDKLEQPPRLWSEVLDLARRGMVVMPGFPADVFLNFMALCVTFGVRGMSEVEAALRALDLLRELASLLPAAVWDLNPIAVYESMASGAPFAYCPFAYTYNNYARAGFSSYRLRFTEPPAIDGRQPVVTILGGTGIAISHDCQSVDVALRYAQSVAGPEWQIGIYALAGGQPAHRRAWNEPALDALTGGFFRDTKASLERAAVRPRYAGYTKFQAVAGEVIVSYLRNGGLPRQTIERLRSLRNASHAEAGVR